MKTEKTIAVFLLTFVSLLTNISCSSFSLQCANCYLSDAYQDKKALELLRAVVNGDSQKIAKLVKEGASPNHLEEGKVPILIWAICANSLDGFEALLIAGADPNLGGTGYGKGNGEGFGNGMFKKRQGIRIAGSSSIKSGWSAMVFASAFQNSDFLKLAIQYGGELNSFKGDSGSFPLLVASEYGQLENIKILIKAGADINAHDEKYNYLTAPILSIGIFARYDIAIWLLENGYNYNLESLAYAAESRMVNKEIQPEKEKLIKMFEARGVKFPDPKGKIAGEVKRRKIPEEDIMDIVYGKKSVLDYPELKQGNN